MFIVTAQGARSTSISATTELVKALHLVKLYKKNQSSGGYTSINSRAEVDCMLWLRQGLDLFSRPSLSVQTPQRQIPQISLVKETNVHGGSHAFIMQINRTLQCLKC